MSSTFVLLLSLLTAPDPRIELVEHQIRHDAEAALSRLEQLLDEDPAAARAMGLDYLRGHLLLRLDRQEEALQAFAKAMATTPELEPWGRFRLALEQERLGHPEVAAGLVATLLGSTPPKSLMAPAVDLLERTLSKGGDCRLLRGLRQLRLRTRERRRLELARARCDRRQGRAEPASERLLKLLDQDTEDDTALVAAQRLSREVKPSSPDARKLLLIGLSFYHHREFEIATRYLARRKTANRP